MNLIKDFIPENSKCATGRKLKATTITIHWIGPFPGQTPKIVRDYWLSPDCANSASAHFIIKDDTVLQCWPIDVVAYHAGCKAGNHSSIGIEVCPENKEGKFSDKSIATLKELLQTLPNLPLVRHFDWTGKDCPKYYVPNDRWKELLKALGKD